MSDISEVITEELIQKKLESSGELGKMHAMVMDATLRYLSSDEGTGNDWFMPSPLLSEAKKTVKGRQALSIVVDYLEHLGLSYTLNILRHEASLAEDTLEEKKAIIRKLNLSDTAEPILMELLQASGKGQPSATHSNGDANATAATYSSPPAAAAAAAAAAVVVAPSSQIDGAVDSTYFLSKWTDRVFYRSGGQVSGQQVQLEYLTNCTVYILDPLDSMTVDDCVGGELIVAACEGSIFLRNCKNMTLHVACKQLRTRDCQDVTLNLFASTDPVIESSHHMTFKPFHLRLPGLKNCFATARLDPKMNRFLHVYDFTEDDARLPSPHFYIAFPNHGLQMTDRCGEKGKPECPSEIEDLLEGRIAPASSSEAGKGRSYNIKTGAQNWTGKVAESGTDKGDGARAGSAAAALGPLPSTISSFSNSARPPLAAHVGTPAAASRIDVAAVATGRKVQEGSPEGSYSSFDDDGDDKDTADDDDDDDFDVEEDSDDF